jgi:hypothetical protein
MLDRIAETALMNARGNSGIIFAQFLFGVSSETADRSSVSIELFTASVKNAVRYIYKAVSDPVEGTLLDHPQRLGRLHRRISSTGSTILASCLWTPRQSSKKRWPRPNCRLDVLAKADVVDAGANAFVYFIDGIIECIRKNSIRHLVKLTVDKRVQGGHKRPNAGGKRCSAGSGLSLLHGGNHPQCVPRSQPAVRDPFSSMAIPSWLPVQPKPAVCMSTPAIRTGYLKRFSTTEP